MHPTSRGLECPKYEKLIPKRSAKSPAWSFFSLPADEDGKIVSENVGICNLCKYPVSSKGGSTSNLISHLKNYHPAEYSKSSLAVTSRSKPLVVPAVEIETFASTSTASTTGADIDTTGINEIPPSKRQKTMLDFQPLSSSSEKQCTASVAKFIATAMQPYNIVESKPFVEMVKTLNPRYRLPGRKFFAKNAVPKLYIDTRDKIKKELKLIPSSNVSITTDCWTSISNIPFISVTAHFIDDKWDLKSVCLSCVHFDVDHTHLNISEVLQLKLAEWDINVNELCCCTTDNGANIVKAVTAFNVQHVPCFGHVINIGVNRALELAALHRAVVRAKKLQNTISHSWKMSRDFCKAQEALGMQTLKLPSACPTRWWSTTKLCKRILTNQLPLCKMLQDYQSKKHLMLENSEVTSLEDFISETALMEDITKNLSGEQYTTASSILPLLMKMKKKIQPKESDRPLVKNIKQKIMSALDERYFENEELMSLLRLCTVCDPRFRLQYVDSKDDARRLVLSHMLDIYNIDTDISSISKNNEKREKSGLEKLLESDDEGEEEETGDDIPFPAKKAESELCNYLAMPKINLNDNPLTWWRAHEISFPTLKNLAKKFLAVQGTSVPSERVFSTGGNVICKSRASLLAKNADLFAPK